MTATYSEDISGVTLDPTIYLKGLPMAAAPSTTSVRSTYGLATSSNAPTGTAEMTAPIQLAAGQSHTFSVAMPVTTATGINYYVELPTGFMMTGATDPLDGDIFYAWTNTGQRWFYNIGRANNQNNFTITIRRNP